jgi:hypothetical protein
MYGYFYSLFIPERVSPDMEFMVGSSLAAVDKHHASFSAFMTSGEKPDFV